MGDLGRCVCGGGGEGGGHITVFFRLLADMGRI